MAKSGIEEKLHFIDSRFSLRQYVSHQMSL